MEAGRVALTLSDGTRAVIRPIRPSDGESLQRGLKRLSPTGKAYRFLQSRPRFSEQELYYLTHCDCVDHFALVLAITDDKGDEIDAVGVTRCIRDKNHHDQAEVAIVLVDEWQRHGGGARLLRELAAVAWKAGIRQWQTLSMVDNTAAPRVMAHVGKAIWQRRVGQGLVEALYQLDEPRG